MTRGSSLKRSKRISRRSWTPVQPRVWRHPPWRRRFALVSPPDHATASTMCLPVPGGSQIWANSSCTSAVPVVWRHEALRSSSKRNAGVHARSSKHAERLGRDAMLDALLLSRTNFLVKSISGLSDYAMAFSPGRRLINNSFDLSVKSNDGGQPRGHWIPEHLFRGHDWAGRGCSATGA